MTQKRRISSTLRRILSVLLCLCMTLSLMPVTALAEPEPSEPDGGGAGQGTAAVLADGDASAGSKHIAALPRTLVSDDFSTADNWAINNADIVKIENGALTIKGGGPCNRAGYKVGKISADDFLIQLDLTRNAGDTNSNVKIAFKCTDQYEGDRLQLRFDSPNNLIYLERTSNNGVGSYTKEWSESGSLPTETGKTYAVDIRVKDNTITAYVDGQQVITQTHTDIGTMAQGYFAIAGQFTNQDFSISNLKITTDETPTGDQYTVTLKTATDGIEDATPGSGGGTVTADKMTGHAGDTITLSVNPAHGYVFDRYEILKSDGTSTNGLMPITNNKFVLNSDFGSVIVVAHFKTREPGLFELFYDDFAADRLDEKYTAQDAGRVTQADGFVVIDASTGATNCLALNSTIWSSKLPDEGYRISVDAWRGSDENGTMQIMFKGSFDDRYVLAINTQGKAFFRHIHPQNEALKDGSFDFSGNGKKFHLVLEVQGGTVVFYADGTEILSYTSQDSWGNASNAAGLINMTPNVPVCFDNLLVERIPALLSVQVKTYRLSGGAEVEDTGYTAGTVTASASSAVGGDKVTLTALAKAGYSLPSYTVTDADGTAITVTDNAFTVPESAAGPITVKAVFAPAAPRDPRDFYIDSVGGNDNDNDDGTIDQPWKTLGKLTSYTAANPLVPGDRVLLKRGSEFNGEQLKFSGMGSAEKPVTVTAYGDDNGDDNGDLPQLNGQGAVENVVYLYNQEYITISDLEITNTHPTYNSGFTQNSSDNRSLDLRGVRVVAKDFGVVSGITIKNCYIHEINGNIGQKWNGGIFFDVQADVRGGELVGIPTKYDHVLIEGCTLINVDRSGIKLVSSAWCSQWKKNSPALPVNWYPSTNVVVRGNYLEKIGGDGITTRDTDGALIEYNLAKDCRYQETGYNVAIWPFQAANTVIQYNEVCNTHSTEDGQGLDCDHASSYSLMQYNYSHNNEGGFMLIMGGYPHTAATVRYNISQNDCDKTFEFAQGLPMGTMIYNNTLYSKSGVSKGILYLSNTAVGRGINDFYMFNNLFIYPEGQTFYGGQVDDLKNHIKSYNNAYVGGIDPPAEHEQPIVVASAAKVLVNAGSGPEDNNTKAPVTGASGGLDGYRLKENSELINMGVTMAQAITYFGGEGFQVFDGRDLPPSELENEYYGKGETSLKYVMGENFPDGVAYDKDFFGGSNCAEGVPDIGAAEYQPKGSAD